MFQWPPTGPSHILLMLPNLLNLIESSPYLIRFNSIRIGFVLKRFPIESSRWLQSSDLISLASIICVVLTELKNQRKASATRIFRQRLGSRRKSPADVCHCPRIPGRISGHTQQEIFSINCLEKTKEKKTKNPKRLDNLGKETGQ